MNKHLKSKIQKLIGVQFHKAKRGIDLFHDIDSNFGARNISTVFDVGANIGQSTLTYSEWFPLARIFSFEPVLTTFAQLERNVKKLKHVNVYQYGLGNKAEKSQIHIHCDHSQNSIKYAGGSLTEKIKLTTLDKFCTQNKIDDVDFLKIDTEGFEMEVLQGSSQLLKQQKIGLIFLETSMEHHFGQFVPLNEIFTYLSKFGYEFFGLYDQQPYWHGKKSLHFCNAAFINQIMSEK